MLVLCVPVLSQSDWQFVGFGESANKQEKAVFYFDDTSIVRTGDEIIFKGLFAKFTLPSEAKGEIKLIISKEYYVVSVILANCKTFTYSVTQQYGRWGFDKNNQPIKIQDTFERDDKTAVDGQMIYKTLRLACSLKPDSKNRALHDNSTEPKIWVWPTTN